MTGSKGDRAGAEDDARGGGEVQAQVELDIAVAREIAGELGAHLRQIRDALGVQVTQRGATLWLAGEASARGRVALAVRLIEQLGRMAADGRPIHPSDVRDGLRILGADPTTDLGTFFRDVVVLDARRRAVTARTPNQREYVAAMRRSELVFGVGPAGSGKTFLAMATAVAMLRKGAVRRIILSRPAVEAGEKLGFLPGDLSEKVDPYLRPLFDALGEMFDREELGALTQKGVIEVAPLAFMRGRTLQDAFVVLDEAQNATVEQMKMFLTRMGPQSRMVVTGDPTQVDLPRDRRSGLAHALGLLRGVQGVDVVELTSEDIVRHPLVARIVDAYAKDSQEELDRQEAQRLRRLRALGGAPS
jgi:phosphate starvation-inducible PhoH-like protein